MFGVAKTTVVAGLLTAVFCFHPYALRSAAAVMLRDLHGNSCARRYVPPELFPPQVLGPLTPPVLARRTI